MDDRHSRRDIPRLQLLLSLVAMHPFATSTAEQFLELGKTAAAMEVEPADSGQTPHAARGRGC